MRTNYPSLEQFRNAVAARDVERTLTLLGEACSVHRLPRNVREEEAHLAVYEKFAYIALEGNWKRLDRIKTDSYFRTTIRNKLKSLDKRKIKTRNVSADDSGECPFANIPFRVLPSSYEVDEETGVDALLRAVTDVDQRRVLVYVLQQKEKPTISEISDALEVHRNTVSKIIKKLNKYRSLL